MGLLLGTERIILVSDKSTAKAVMVDKSSSFQKEGTAFFPGSQLAGKGMLVIDGDLWKRQRRLSNPAFRQSAIENYSRAMVGSTNRLLSRWQDGEERDVYADFNTLTLNVTLEAIFGQKDESQDSATTTSVVEAVERVFEYFTKMAGSTFVLPEWVPTPDNIDFSLQVAQLDEVIYRLIRQRRRELSSGEAAAAAPGGGDGERRDLLQALLTAKDEETGLGMSDKSLRDELMTMLIAGQETSAILLGWAMALLAHHPEIQSLAAAEVDGIISSSSSPHIQAADIRRMPYIESVVLEALRLYPPAYMVGRCASEDVKLPDGIEVMKGTTILISPYLMQRDESYWGVDPDSFDPTRWRDWQQGPEYKGAMGFMSNLGPNGAYVPFGAGPRNCIGTGFALMEACLVIASIVQSFRVEEVAGRDFPSPKALITLRPDGVVLRIRRRNVRGGSS